ncbi:MAG: putative transport system ATP-binding protein [Solirubrobacteraceae bacterium]|jgi:putative ABC transport system ATP-binding protein|nr:putative transport system ATP-binding protein [Solirubrobacteraceae bacterium]
MDDAVIQTTDLRMRYAQGELSVEALRGVDFTVRAGEFVAIMGPSGSGKSTLLSILGCLERPTGGSYRIAGEEVAGFDESKAARVRRDRIGFVFQGFNLLLRSTAAQNVELPLFYAGVGRNERRERTRAALESVGLGERADHLPRQLSGGQQQRVAVARAIVSRPDVVLADEPTGNLDSTSQDEVLAVLGDVHARGATIVMVTHSREVAEHATRIVHVLDGLINADESLVAAAP